jgi:hypothetical protein
MSPRSLLVGAAICVAALVAGVAVYAAVGPGGRMGAEPTVAETTAGRRAPIPAHPGTAGSTGVKPPSAGAYFGAYVQPSKYLDPERIDAVQEYQRSLGRELDIVHNFHTWTDPFPDALDTRVATDGGIPLISWAVEDTHLVVDGTEDELIKQRARDLKKLHVPVLLRWRWEMDRPNLKKVVHSPRDYIDAWKRIRALFAAEGATNASFVWCPLADGFVGGRAQPYYPGDDQVDWLCADAYSDEPTSPLGPTLQPFLDWAKHHDKPIIIGEYGTQPGQGTQRAAWITQTAAFFRLHPQIKAVVYFDCQVDRDGRKRDWSLRTHQRDLAAMQAMAEQPRFNPLARGLTVD